MSETEDNMKVDTVIRDTKINLWTLYCWYDDGSDNELQKAVA